MTGATFMVIAVACLVVGILRRHHVEDAVGSIEGAYLNRSIGHPSFAGVFGGNMLDPFHPLNAYLWLGASAAFAVAALAIFIVARVSSR